MSSVPQSGEAEVEGGVSALVQKVWWLPGIVVLLIIVCHTFAAALHAVEIVRLLFTTIAICTVAHLVLKNGSQVGTSLTKLLLDIVVAVGFSIFFIAVMHPPSEPLPGPTKYIYIFAVALVLFALELVAETARRLVTFEEKQGKTIRQFEQQNLQLGGSLEQLDKSSTGLTKALNAIGDASKVLEEGRYAAIAAKALKIAVYNRDNCQPRMAEAVQAALDTIPVWHRAGAQVNRTSAQSPAEMAASNAWWKAVQIYHQEEKYDLSRYEFATNVRNYAFMILGVLKEFLEGVRKRDDGRKVVVLQASAFPPKDFYNYPCGTSSRRYYVDREFFGTYRRALSLALSDHSIVPLRLLFASDVRTSEPSANANGLGWTLDDPEKIYLDCARLRIVPASVEVKPELAKALAVDDLQEIHDPARRKQRLSKGYPWVPVYADLSNVDSSDIARRLWGERAGALMGMDAKEVNHLSTGRVTKKQPFLSRFEDAMKDYKEYATWVEGCESSLWTGLLEACWQQIRPEEGKVPKDIVGELANKDNYPLQPTEGTEEAWGEARKIGMDVLQQIDAKRRKLLVDIKSLHRSFNTNVGMDTLDLVERVQEFDSSLAVLSSLRGRRMRVQQAALGGAMGVGESWLYGFLNRLDWLRREAAIVKAGPPPAWNVFRSDLLSRQDDPPDFGGDADHFQLVVVHEGQPAGEASRSNDTGGDFSESGLPRSIVTVSSMEDGDIYPEFLIVSELECDEDREVSLTDPRLLSRLKQGVLIGVDMSEPLQTCRIEFDFQTDQSDGTGPLSRHLKWLEKQVLPNSNKATAWFLHKLSEERRSVK